LDEVALARSHNLAHLAGCWRQRVAEEQTERLFAASRLWWARCLVWDVVVDEFGSGFTGRVGVGTPP
jgi:hypothetical protein